MYSLQAHTDDKPHGNDLAPMKAQMKAQTLRLGRRGAPPRPAHTTLHCDRCVVLRQPAVCTVATLPGCHAVADAIATATALRPGGQGVCQRLHAALSTQHAHTPSLLVLQASRRCREWPSTCAYSHRPSARPTPASLRGLFSIVCVQSTLACPPPSASVLLMDGERLWGWARRGATLHWMARQAERQTVRARLSLHPFPPTVHTVECSSEHPSRGARLSPKVCCGDGRTACACPAWPSVPPSTPAGRDRAAVGGKKHRRGV